MFVSAEGVTLGLDFLSPQTILRLAQGYGFPKKNFLRAGRLFFSGSFQRAEALEIFGDSHPHTTAACVLPIGGKLSTETKSTPCVGLCSLQEGYCVGCGRSRDEIARWASMSESQRRAVMARLRSAEKRSE